MFQLISLISRDIEVSFHDSFHDAQEAMVNSFCDVLYPYIISKQHAQELKEKLLSELSVMPFRSISDMDGRFGFNEDYAYTRSDCEEPCDWMIVDLSLANQETN